MGVMDEVFVVSEADAHDSVPDLPRGSVVEVRLFAAAAAAIGVDRTTVHARTLADVVERLAERTDAEGARVIARSSLLLNAVACRDRDRALSPGDRVDVLPPFAGG